MYAIVETGGKQHRVTEGDHIKVEYLSGEVGSTVEFDRVLLVCGEKIAIGNPLVKGAKVTAEIVSHGNHPKVIIHKHLRRKNYERTRGHKQLYTELLVRSIVHA